MFNKTGFIGSNFVPYPNYNLVNLDLLTYARYKRW